MHDLIFLQYSFAELEFCLCSVSCGCYTIIYVKIEKTEIYILKSVGGIWSLNLVNIPLAMYNFAKHYIHGFPSLTYDQS